MLDGGRRKDWSGQLPGGAGDLTLAELQEMSSRQQQQMEAQQQVLVAKEQRLKYLKQQEARHAQLASESEQLRRIRERVENQELKLKKLRALRGQAEQYRNNNGHLTSELDAVKAVFNEKEKELALAVTRVDQLTRQLQELRNGVVSGNKQAGAAMELEKLRKELLIRNKLNEQQSNTIAAKEKVLSQRREEVTRMDARIYELQQRLKKRRNQEQLASNQNQSKKVPHRQGNMGPNVATVEPYIQYAPYDVIKDDSFTKSGSFTKQDPKYQTLPCNVKFIPPSRQLGEDERMVGDKHAEMNNNETIEEYRLPIVLPTEGKNQTNYQQHPSVGNNNNNRSKANLNYPLHMLESNKIAGGHQKPGPAEISAAKPVTSSGQKPSPQDVHGGDHKGGPGQINKPSLSSSASSSSRSGPHPVISISEMERQAGSGQSSPASSEGSDSSGGIQVKPDNEVNTAPIGPVSAMIERLNKTVGGHSAAPSQPDASQRTKPVAGQDKPHALTHFKQSNQTPAPGQDSVDSGRQRLDSSTGQPPPVSNQSQASVSSPGSLPSPGGPHLNQKPAPTYRYASKNQIANTYMGRLGGAAMEKYQRNLNLLYKNMDFQANKGGNDKQAGDSAVPSQPQQSGASAGAEDHSHFGLVGSPNYPDIASDKGSYKLNTPKHIRRRHSDSENEDLNKALQDRQELEHQRQQQGTNGQENAAKANNSKSDTVPASSTSSGKPDTARGGTETVKNNQNTQVSKDKSSESLPASTQKTQSKNRNSSSSTPKVAEPVSKAEVVRRTKSNLKKEGVRRSSNRVSFDPLALLLDASLEGELDLVKKVAVQVENVSTPNDEGITALHNAICAGHYEIVKFLVEFGCDVNSPDSDGWTPLHCAASCNNLPMVRFLVEHGACVFATTISDQETAADKCEEEEDGYDSCSDYLYSIQEKLGITNNGEVYAVFDYTASNQDELSFVIGDGLTVLRKGDDTEKEWWWARQDKQEGYIPRNLLGLYPRVIPEPSEVSDC